MLRSLKRPSHRTAALAAVASVNMSEAFIVGNFRQRIVVRLGERNRKPGIGLWEWMIYKHLQDR